MKPKRTLPTIALATTTLPTASAQTLTETLQSLNYSLSTFNSYIQTQPALFAAINGTSNITILAPSNDALAAVTLDDLDNSDPELVEAFWDYHILRGVWWTSNLTAGTGGGGGGGSAAAAAAAKRRTRRRRRRDDSAGGDGSGIDGNSLFIPTLLTPDSTPMYANVSGGQRIIARSSSSSSSSSSVVSFYSGTTGSGGSQPITKSTITQANFNFSGGTIHIIDHVLSIPSRLNDTLASFGPSRSSSSSSSPSSSSSSTNGDDDDETALLSLTASVGALSRANLTYLFNTQQDITMFVPSNEAWNRVGSVVSDMNQTKLADIMGYHVLKGQKGKVFYSDLLEQQSDSSDTRGGDDQDKNEKDYDTVEGGTVKVRVVDGSTTSTGDGTAADDDDDDTSGSGSGSTSKQVFVNGARVVKSDVLVENGVVHVVDCVLNPSNSTATPIPTASTEPDAWEGATTTNSVPFTAGVQSPTTSLGQNGGGGGVITATSGVQSPTTSLGQNGGGGGGVVTTTSTITVGGPSPSAAKSGAAGKTLTAAIGMTLLWGGFCVFANL